MEDTITLSAETIQSISGTTLNLSEERGDLEERTCGEYIHILQLQLHNWNTSLVVSKSWRADSIVGRQAER
jgi:hypothetical protein